MIYTAKAIISVFLLVSLAACQSTPAIVDQGAAPEKPVAGKKVKQPGKVRLVDQESIDQWVSAHKYTKVLDSLESVPESTRSEQDNIRIARIKDLADTYDRQQSKKIDELYSSGKKATALKMLSDAFENYPDGPRLFYVKQKIEKDMSGYLRDIESQLLIAKGEWLLQSSPLLQEYQKAKPGDKSIQQQVQDAKQEIINISDKLTALGIHAMSAGKFEHADQRLNMANTLHPSGENISALARLDQLRLEKKIKARKLSQAKEERKRRSDTRKLVKMQKRKQEQTEKTVTKLIEEVRRSLARGNLKSARSQFEQLRKFGPGSIEMDALQKSLDAAIRSKVKGIIIRGGELYSNGNIKQARDLWQSALEIDPENANVKRRIARANQVLHKLKELQNKASTAEN